MNLSEQLAEMNRPGERQNEIFNAPNKDQSTDKIKLTREQETELCKQYRLGFYQVTEGGNVIFRHRPCQNYDICIGCRMFKAQQHRNLIESNEKELKKTQPNAKRRVMKNVPEDQIDTVTKRVKRHKGICHTAPGEEAGTRDIVAIVEDDPRKDEQQNTEFFGIEQAEYDYEAALSRQAEMSANGEQKRMAGALIKKRQMPQQEDTYLLRLPKFRVRTKDRGVVDQIAKSICPWMTVDNEIQHQNEIYNIANRFAEELEDRGIEYDVKMSFKNVPESSRKEFNAIAKCPDNSISLKDNGVSRTNTQPVFASAMQKFYHEAIYPGLDSQK